MHELDYIYETADSLDGRIAALEASARDAREEAAEARKLPGLEGPAEAAEAQAKQHEAELSDLRLVKKRIERGYPHWDRIGFEVALEAYGEPWRWDDLSETVTADYIFGHDTDVRLPLEAQQAYRHALNSGLFESFEVCSCYETEGDYVTSTSYYLFGISNLTTRSAMFLVATW